MTISDRVRVKNINVLSDRHYRLDEVEFESGPSGGTRLRLRKRLVPVTNASNER